MVIVIVQMVKMKILLIVLVLRILLLALLLWVFVYLILISVIFILIVPIIPMNAIAIVMAGFNALMVAVFHPPGNVITLMIVVIGRMKQVVHVPVTLPAV